MKTTESNKWLLVNFDENEKDIAEMLQEKLSNIGVYISEDLLTWKIRTDYKEKFDRLVKRHLAKTYQRSLF